jgi:uncharacterized protein YggE
MGIKLVASSGGSVELVPTNTASNFTVTVPAKTGTMAMDGPAFSAQSATTQSISNTTFTKITLGTENFDTNSNFASSTFTPTVAGYYQINAGIFYNNSATSGLGQIFIYKNGAAVNVTVSNMSAGGYCGLSIATLVYCNGSTDYIDLYTYHAFGSAQSTSSGNYVYMTGSFVRGA